MGRGDGMVGYEGGKDKEGMHLQALEGRVIIPQVLLGTYFHCVVKGIHVISYHIISCLRREETESKKRGEELLHTVLFCLHFASSQVLASRNRCFYTKHKHQTSEALAFLILKKIPAPQHLAANTSHPSPSPLIIPHPHPTPTSPPPLPPPSPPSPPPHPTPPSSTTPSPPPSLQT